MKKRNHVAVVGAGIGGLAVATALVRDGWRVTVFDQFAEPAPVGSGLVIQPIGQAVLRAVGAETAMRYGATVSRMTGREIQSGRLVLDVGYGDRFGLAIHRGALFQALLEAAQGTGVEIATGHRVTGMHGNRLEFGPRIQGPFDLVIDASGAGSPLSPIKARSLGYGALWATVDWPDTDLPTNELRQVYRKARHMVGVLPIGRTPGSETKKAAIFWSLPSDGFARWHADGLTSWKEQAAALWPDFAPFCGQICQADQLTMARYSHGTLRKPYRDGVVFIGDASHRASPQLGQGANMALLDAWAFAMALRHSRGDFDLAAAHYARARRWHVRSYQMMSAVFTPMYQSKSNVLPWLRDQVFCPLSRVPPVPGVLTRLVCGDLMPPYGSLPAPDQT